MDTAVKDIQLAEIILPDALEEKIDEDIEQSEREIANGDYTEAHEAFRLIKGELGFV